MEKVISNEMTKVLMILGAITLAFSFVMVKTVGAVKSLFIPYRKQTIIYGIVLLLLFGLIAFLAYPSLVESPVTLLILFQAAFFLLGMLHIYFMKKNLGWAGEKKAFYLDTVFSVFICLAGSIVFLLVCQWINKPGLILTMGTSVMFFLIPLFFYKTYVTAISIPPKIMKEWFYPIGDEMEEPDDSKLTNLYVISFEFRKQVTDNDLTIFRAKAPAQMEFGQLFYYFINDYNERHPGSRIEFKDSSGQAYGWVFYKKPGWKTIFTRYIDSGTTVINNRIRENDIVICARSVQ